MPKSALGRYIRQVNKLDVRRGKDTERQKKRECKKEGKN